MLSRPTTDRQDPDFRAVPTPSPEGYDRLLDQVVQVSRLREVRALVGFTRLAAPERGDLEPVSRVPLSRAAPQWVPAVEQRGEGIFLQLREDAVARLDGPGRRASPVAGAGRRLPTMGARHGAYPQSSFPFARVTLHPHFQPHAHPPGRAGVRVFLGEHPRTLVHRHAAAHRRPGCCCPRRPATARARWADWSRWGSASTSSGCSDHAFEDAQRCSSDPLCAEHVPYETSPSCTPPRATRACLHPRPVRDQQPVAGPGRAGGSDR